MLILSRRELECICLGDDIVLTIVSIGSDKVRIGVTPPDVRILRNELELTSNDDSVISVPLVGSQPVLPESEVGKNEPQPGPLHFRIRRAA